MILLDPYRFTSGGATNDFLTSLHSVWDFEESSGTLNDETGTYTATTSVVTYGATGKKNNCLEFSGAWPWVDLASAGDYKFLHDGSDWSFSIWVQNDTPNGDRDAIIVTNSVSSGQVGICLLWDNLASPSRTRYLYFEMTNGIGGQRVFQITNDLFWPNDTDWHHVVLTHDGSTLRVYLDGSLGASASKSGHAYSTANEYERKIGNRGAGSFAWDGKMDEVYFWEDRVLTDDEVSDLYNSGTGLFYDSFS